MLFALATPGSAFKPSIGKPKNTWRLNKFRDIYLDKSSRESSPKGSISFDFDIKF